MNIKQIYLCMVHSHLPLSAIVCRKRLRDDAYQNNGKTWQIQKLLHFYNKRIIKQIQRFMAEWQMLWRNSKRVGRINSTNALNVIKNNLI